MPPEHAPTADGERDPNSDQGRGEGRPAHQRLIYELFVLGELLDGPRHGYQLREILGRLLGPFRQISWGMLYPLIHELEREGLVTSRIEPSAVEGASRRGGGKPRRPYVITAEGRERFEQLMNQQGDYHADHRELFIVKLNNFDYLSTEQQVSVLWQYRQSLQVEDLFLCGGRQQLLANPSISEGHRDHILRIIDFRLTGVRSEMRWIDEQIEELEQLPGQSPKAIE
jgi:DNA-binding PadR family transcriptional regulator